MIALTITIATITHFDFKEKRVIDCKVSLKNNSEQEPKEDITGFPDTFCPLGIYSFQSLVKEKILTDYPKNCAYWDSVHSDFFVLSNQTKDHAKESANNHSLNMI